MWWVQPFRRYRLLCILNTEITLLYFYNNTSKLEMVGRWGYNPLASSKLTTAAIAIYIYIYIYIPLIISELDSIYLLFQCDFNIETMIYNNINCSVPNAVLLGFLRSNSNNPGTDGIVSLIFLILIWSNLAIQNNKNVVMRLYNI